MQQPHTSQVDHRYSCAVRCLCNALIALARKDDAVRQFAAARWINRATRLLASDAGLPARDRARLAAMDALLKDVGLANAEQVMGEHPPLDRHTH